MLVIVLVIFLHLNSACTAAVGAATSSPPTSSILSACCVTFIALPTVVANIKNIAATSAEIATGTAAV